MKHFIATLCVLGIIGVLLAASWLFTNKGVRWNGRKRTEITVIVKTTELPVIVREAGNGSPIPNASVKLFHPNGGRWKSEGRTDADGRVGLNHTFSAVGTESSIRRSGSVQLFGLTLKVDADGYKGLEEPLEMLTGPTWNLYDLPLPDVKVELKKK